MSAVIKSSGQLRLMCYKAEIVMSIEAWYFLHGTTNGVCNLFYFLSLLSKMQTAEVQVGKRGQIYTVNAGQADGSLLGLSREWRIGRKAVRRLLDDFAEHGIIAVESNPLTSLISLVCVRSWVIDGRSCRESDVPPVSREVRGRENTPLERPAVRNTAAEFATGRQQDWRKRRSGI